MDDKQYIFLSEPSANSNTDGPIKLKNKYVESNLTDSQPPNSIMSVANRYEFLKSEFASFVSLADNWDGYGAVPVFTEVAEKASKLIVCLPGDLIDNITDFYPNPNGTITIEWENRIGEKLFLEIGKNSYSYFLRYKDKDPILVDGKDIILDFKRLASTLGELFSEETISFLF